MTSPGFTKFSPIWCKRHCLWHGGEQKRRLRSSKGWLQTMHPELVKLDLLNDRPLLVHGHAAREGDTRIPKTCANAPVLEVKQMVIKYVSRIP